MDVFMNDNKLDELTISEGTLEEAVRTVQNDWCAPGQLVINLRCDGRDVPAGQMTEILNKSVSDFNRLEVYTGAPGDLVRDAMEQALNALANTAETNQAVADQLTQGQIGEAVEMLAQNLHIWQQIHEALAKSVQMLNIDADKITIEGKSLTEAIGKPKDLLLQIKDALEGRDYVLLADVLQYEFADVSKQWEAILKEVRVYAEHADNPEN